MNKHTILVLFITVLSVFSIAFIISNLNNEVTITAKALGDASLANDFQKGANYARTHQNENWYGSQRSNEMKQHMKEIGIEWIAVTPFGSQASVTDTEIGLFGNRVQRDAQLKKEISDAHSLGMKVMFKPHIWSRDFSNNEKWRGDIKFDNAKDLEEWFDSYNNYILYYARLAEEAKAEMFVIGHELASVSKHTDEWRSIIKNVRGVYFGKIIYSAHESELETIKFWNELDFIGLSSYFTLTNKKDATLAEMKNGWISHLERIKKVSEKYNKPVIFTEIGYRAVLGTTNEPWQWDDDEPLNYDEQKEAYQALFESIYNKEFIKGIYIWKYHTDSEFENKDKRDFPIYKKPAEEVVKNWFK